MNKNVVNEEWSFGAVLLVYELTIRIGGIR